jgi:alpha/beta superfamily hydrolase
MDNNVICAVAQRLAARCAVLRFDYRGVGESEIALGPDESAFDYWNAIEETKDYRDAVEDVAAAARALLTATQLSDVSLFVVGYSFGAATGMLFACRENGVKKMVAIAPPLGKVSFDFLADCHKPSLHLIGKKDFLYSEEKMAAFRQSVGPAAKVVILDQADHFFRGDEDSVARQVEEYLLSTKGNQHGS